MNYAHEITKLSALVAQANVHPQLSAIDDIKARIAAEREAMNRAEARRDQLAQELKDAREQKIDGDALADQFRAGAVETKATRDVPAIQTDQQGVVDAMGKIRWKLEDLDSELRRARAELAMAIARPIEKIEDALLERLDSAYAELIAVYVDMTALREAFCAPMLGQKLAALREILIELQCQEISFYRTQHEANPAIAEAVTKHRDLIRAADLRPTTSITLMF